MAIAQVVDDLKIALESFKQELANKEISKLEYDTLVSQLLDVSKVDKYATTIEDLIQLAQVVSAL